MSVNLTFEQDARLEELSGGDERKRRQFVQQVFQLGWERFCDKGSAAA